MTDREIIILALQTLIAKLREERRENTYSAIMAARLGAAERALDNVLRNSHVEPV